MMIIFMTMMITVPPSSASGGHRAYIRITKLAVCQDTDNGWTGGQAGGGDLHWKINNDLDEEIGTFEDGDGYCEVYSVSGIEYTATYGTGYDFEIRIYDQDWFNTDTFWDGSLDLGNTHYSSYQGGWSSNSKSGSTTIAPGIVIDNDDAAIQSVCGWWGCYYEYNRVYFEVKIVSN